MQAHILHQLDQISCQLANMFKEKGKKKAKPQDLMQPDYVKTAKKKMEDERKKKVTLSKEEMDSIEAFWKKRNPDATFLGGKDGK